MANSTSIETPDTSVERGVPGVGGVSFLFFPFLQD